MADEQPEPRSALEELRWRPPTLTVTPTPTLFTVAAEVMGARRSVPPQWMAAVEGALDRRDREALAPIGDGPSPDLVSLVDAAAPADVPDALERLATLAEEDLLRDIEASVPRSPLWDVVAEHPRQWLVRYARALQRVWDAMQPRWAAAGPLLERELDRVLTAARNDALPELFASVDGQAFGSGGRWLPQTELRAKLDYGDDVEELRPIEEGLALMPVLSGPGSARLLLPERGVVAAVLYPLPGVGRLIDGDLPTNELALEALLGSQRAAMLRALDRPRHAGSLATALQLSPGAVSYHVTALEAAGLVLRERDGRRVFVHRTTRGTVLLALYE